MTSLTRLKLGSARRLTRDCNCGLYVEMLVIQSREPIGRRRAVAFGYAPDITSYPRPAGAH